MLLAGYDSAQQNGRIDRRHLSIPDPLAGIYICPVIKKSSVVGQLLPQEPKRSHGAFSGRRHRNPAAFLTDAEGRQAEPSCRKASYNAFVISFDATSILHQTRFGISLLPKILKISIFKIIKKLIILW